MTVTVHPPSLPFPVTHSPTHSLSVSQSLTHSLPRTHSQSLIARPHTLTLSHAQSLTATHSLPLSPTVVGTVLYTVFINAELHCTQYFQYFSLYFRYGYNHDFLTLSDSHSLTVARSQSPLSPTVVYSIHQC